MLKIRFFISLLIQNFIILFYIFMLKSIKIIILEITMQWTQPRFEDLRIGFEITMYFETR